MTANPGLLALLARQDGLVTCAQAEQVGMSARTLRDRVRHQGWERVAPRVFLAGGHPFTEAARVRATALWAGVPAALSGPAAAWWHGMLDAPPDDVQVTVPRSRGLRPLAGVSVRRRDLDHRDLRGVDWIRLTAKPLTVLETAAALPRGSEFLDRALQRHVRFEAVYCAHCRNLGAQGSAVAGRLLVAAADRAASAGERLLVHILRDAGIGGWQLGRPFGPWVIDLVFPDAQLAIEVDGWAWHRDLDRFRADRLKGNALVRAGWNLLRFTWHDLTNRPDYVVGEVRAALLAAATHPA